MARPLTDQHQTFETRPLTREEKQRGVSKEFVQALKQAGATRRFLKAVERTRRAEDEAANGDIL